MKNKITKKIKKNKKNIFLTIIVLLMFSFLIFISYNLIYKYLKKKNFENQITSFSNINKKEIFKINDITLFSSSDVKNKLSTRTNFTLENIYTFTDIAIFIDNGQDQTNNTLENTLKSVSIKNLQFTKIPKDGKLNLYYKNINDFAKPLISTPNLIEKDLNFDILYEESKNYSAPYLYNNCANPITLSLVHENIKKDYTIMDTSIPITYNGSLLKRCNIALSSIETSLSFDIYITNNKDQKFKSKIFLKIPYKDSNKSIYDGNITIKPNNNYIFYRYE